MRIYIRTSPNTERVDYDYQYKLVSAVKKWLDTDELRGKISFYSFSSFMDARPTKGGLIFPGGASFFISFHEEEYSKELIRAIWNAPQVCYGMRVLEVERETKPNFEEVSTFRSASPILIRRYGAGIENKHYTYEDEESNELMRESILYKMQQAGLSPDDSLKIRFDDTYPNKKIKLIDYRGVKNRVNQCSVIIEGKPSTKAFIYDVGIGASTGVGFGSIF